MRHAFESITVQILLLLSFICSGQDLSRYPAAYLTEEHGLPSNEVYHCIQGPDGYMWFATSNGIARYDGKEFRVFNRSDGLPLNQVFHFYEQSDSTIVGECMNSQYFTIKDDSIKAFKINDSLLKHIPTPTYSFSFYRDEFGRMNFGTKSGKYVFSKTGELLDVDSLSPEGVRMQLNYQLVGDYVFCYRTIREVPTLNFWLFDQGASRSITATSYPKKIRGQSLYGIKTGPESIAIHSYSRVFLVDSSKLDRIVEIDRQIIGIHCFDNILWICTRNGVFTLDLEHPDAQVRHFFERYSITSVYQSSEGILWITTTSGGIIKIDPQFRELVYEDQRDQNITCIYPRNKKVLIGYEDGTVILDEGPINTGLAKVFHMSEIEDKIIIFKPGPVYYDTEIGEVRPYRSFGPDFKEFGMVHEYRLGDSIWATASMSVIMTIKVDSTKVKLKRLTRLKERVKSFTVFRNMIVFSDPRQITFIDLYDHELIERIPTTNTVIRLFELGEELWGLSEIGEIIPVSNRTKGLIKLPLNQSLYRYNDAVPKNDTLVVAANSGIFYWKIDPEKGNHELLHFDPEKNVHILRLVSDTLYYATAQRVFKRRLKNLSALVPFVQLERLVASGKSHNPKNSIELTHEENDLQFLLGHRSYRAELQEYRYQLVGHDSRSFLTGDPQIIYSSLSPGSYRFEYSATCDGITFSNTKTIDVFIAPPFWMRSWFIILLVILFLGSIYYLVWLRLKKVREKADIQRTISELRSQALTAQLNPHLVFNILNSIQGMVSNQDVERTNLGISLFAKFLRKSLSLSREAQVSSKEELKIAQQYFELEKIRFPEQLEFNTMIETEAQFELPPLIIQPLVENAIKHGLLPSNSDKKIVKLIVKEDREFYLIEVVDNGIGFVDGQGSGDGMRITRQRLKSLRRENDLIVVQKSNPTIVQIRISKES